MAENVAFRGWPHCQLLTNGTVEVIVTTDVGPRVVRYGFTGGDNMLCEVHEQDGLQGGAVWRTFGGHRLWHAPEATPRSYQPDNGPVPFEADGNHLLLQPAVEQATGIQKELEVALGPTGTEVTLTHRLANRSLWPLRLAAWAVTVLAPGGVEVLPQARTDTGILPNRRVVLWPYARMDDPRVHWGRRCVLLRQDPGMQPPFKVGLSDEAGWAAYINHGNVFVKRFPWITGAAYPDFGVNCESYTTDFMLEMESLSPLQELRPGASVTHVETWSLTGGAPAPDCSEAALTALLVERCGLTF